LRPIQTLGLILLLAAGATAAPDRMVQVHVQCEADIEHVWWRDVDADGHPDLILLLRTLEGQRIEVRHAGKDGRVASEADDLGKLDLPLKETVLLTLADLTPDPGLELVGVGPRAVWALVHRDGAFAEVKRLGAVKLAFALPDSEGTRVWPHVFCPASGRRDSILVPVAGGYGILRSGADGLDVTTRVDVPPERSLIFDDRDMFALVTDVPVPSLVDYDGDGRTDILTVSRGRLTAHLQARSGEFSREPTFAYPLSFLANGSGSAGKDAVVRYLVDLKDIDGDKRCDLLVTRTKGKIALFTSFESLHFFFKGPTFYSRERKDLISPPTGMIRVGGASLNPTLLDVDGDGDRDLIITALKADIVGQHVLKRVLAEYRAYRYDAKKGTFEKSPYFSISRRYPVWRLEKGRTDATVFFAGDFDGDGHKDLLDISAGGEKRVEILQGRPGSGMLSSGKYSFRKRLHRMIGDLEADVRILDADGDGADDLLIRGTTGLDLFYTRR
jgi:FG-GAP-like repeat